MSMFKILVLGDPEERICHFLSKEKEIYLHTEDKISADFIKQHKIDIAISYGYRHIIKTDILKALPGKVINLHISLLPWNRGADPNLWSFIDETPKGVSIHHINAGIDTGDLILQKEILFNEDHETLKSSYQKLQDEIMLLFIDNWQNIKNGSIPKKPQIGTGSYHCMKDKSVIFSQLNQGWDTPVKELKKIASGRANSA